VLYIHDRAGKYLEPPSGEFTGEIVAMAREGLRLELATAIRKVGVRKTETRTPHVLVKTNGEDQLINLVVKPISQPPSLEGTLLVIFEDLPPEVKAESQPTTDESIDAEPHPRIRQLEQELRSTKEYLQTTIEELETANEELKSTNEELQSSNEEMQSTNEELETSKEELQSINEELTTVNSELQQKMNELNKTSSDLNNLLSSTQIGTIFLDMGLNIQRFTPTMSDIINLIPTDVGRPISHIVTKMRYQGLVKDAKGVLKTLVPREVEIQTEDDRWFLMRILPYRTIENMIDGVVITFVDITERKRADEALRQSRERFMTMFNEAPLGIALIDSLTGHIYEVNPMFAKIAGRTVEQMANIDWMSITHPDDVQEDLDNMALLNAGKIPGFQMEKRYLHLDGTAVWINMTIAPLKVEDKALSRHLCMIDDITERKHADQRILGILAYAENIVNTVREPLVVLDGEMRVVSANQSFYRMFGVTPEKTEGNLLYDLGNRQWDIPRLHELLEEILPDKTEVRDFEVDHVFPEIGHNPTT
jgi:two-component system CheB/CheR fusion protein